MESNTAEILKKMFIMQLYLQKDIFSPQPRGNKNAAVSVRSMLEQGEVSLRADLTAAVSLNILIR